MIIPMRCFTCGKVLADCWEHFVAARAKIEPDDGDDLFMRGPAVGRILDELGLRRMCCRRHMLGHVDVYAHDDDVRSHALDDS